jgi:hypothetical protein
VITEIERKVLELKLKEEEESLRLSKVQEVQVRLSDVKEELKLDPSNYKGKDEQSILKFDLSLNLHVFKSDEVTHTLHPKSSTKVPLPPV